MLRKLLKEFIDEFLFHRKEVAELEKRIYEMERKIKQMNKENYYSGKNQRVFNINTKKSLEQITEILEQIIKH